MSTVGLKRCCACGDHKPLEAFAIDRSNKGGHAYKCKPCMATYSKRRYEQKRLADGKPYRAVSPLKEWEQIEQRGWMTCRTCGRDQPIADFRASNKWPFRRRQCRACDRQDAARWKRQKRAQLETYNKAYRCRKYGLSLDDYERMLQAQQGLCAICGRKLPKDRQTIDHDHRTGEVRGIVHASCNLVIGNAAEDIAVLQGAIRYLFRRQKTNPDDAIDFKQNCVEGLA